MLATDDPRERLHLAADGAWPGQDNPRTPILHSPLFPSRQEPAARGPLGQTRESPPATGGLR